MKNGFYHQQPNGEDIYVSDAMLANIGYKSINAIVRNSRYDADLRIVADCEYDGRWYVVARSGSGWMVVSEH